METKGFKKATGKKIGLLVFLLIVVLCTCARTNSHQRSQDYPKTPESNDYPHTIFPNDYPFGIYP
jgi:hypothetical protein